MRNIEEIIINGKTLKEVLELHKHYLNEDCEGWEYMKADLSNADLRNADLNNADLRGVYLNNADLRNANLRNADLRGVYLNNADLRNANLRNADLSNVYLRNADLSNVYLRNADLRYVYLNNADLRGADLNNADLRGADLRGVDLSNVEYNELTSFFALQCPEEGSFIGYKKSGNKIVKLLITEDAKRSSATSRKCRCSKAKVLSITSIDKKEEYNEVASNRDSTFIYKVGEIVEVSDFDNSRWNECSTGIHFFITRQEAVNY